MAITFKKYVDITSGVGGSGNVRARDLIGRIFSTNPLIPTKSLIEFTSADEVGVYFGTTSEEYKRAAAYFGFVSKQITRAKKISFARWVDAAVAPRIYGRRGTQALGSWTSITSGNLVMTIGGVTNTMSALNFSGAASLAQVATIIQTAIRTKTGTQWTAATVTYDATRQSFNFEGGATGAAGISVTPGGAGDISGQLGWDTGAVFSSGAAVETITQTLVASADASNNFASFAFIPALTQDQTVEAATWNDLQNVMYMFMVPVTAANYAAIETALVGLSGSAITLSPLSGEYPELAPMILMASTDYSKRNSVMNYMFQIFTLTPSVQSTADALMYDAARINYYGRTQTAGQLLEFYQDGVMTGLPVDPVDQNIYANEIWLKDAAAGGIMTLLLSLNKISANARGRAQLMSQIQATAVEPALFNGTISVGKVLENDDKLYIGELTNDELAWYQVQTIGYWLDVVFVRFVDQSGIQKYKAVYTLIYSKDDTIRKVEGSHVLI